MVCVQRCFCQITRRAASRLCPAPAYARRASTASAEVTIEEKLVRLARQTLSQAAADAGSSTSYASDVEVAKRTKQLESLRDALRQWQQSSDVCKSLQDMIDQDPDEEMREMANLDLADAKEALTSANNRLQSALLPADPTSALGCLMEIKAGVGGSEASIFAGDLMRMYTRLAAGKRWKMDIVNTSAISAGSGGSTDAYREVILEIDASGAYQLLKHEAGVHRVQRVPQTESSGRVHTSTASVIVLPSAPENQASDDVLDEKDVKVEVMRSGGAGGQHVNRTESAVRLTHLPTGITVSMQDTRSQHKNRVKAFQILRSRLLAVQVAERQAAGRAERRAQVRGTDRSEKIRTYNYAQDRVTDHRLPITLNGVLGFLDGDDGKLEMMADEIDRWAIKQQVNDLLDAAT